MTGTTHSTTPSPDLGITMKRSLKKPLMEKRRRDRINTSLTQLKNLVLKATNKDTSQYSKLEKADILEMTVNHLKKSQYQQMAVASNVDPHSTGKFRLGFAECAAEVTRYLSNVDGFNPEIRSRLLNHLSNSYQQKPLAQQQAPVSTLTSSLPGSYHPNTILNQRHKHGHNHGHKSHNHGHISPQMNGHFATQMNGQVTLVPVTGTLSPPMSPIQNISTFPQGFQVTPLYINNQPKQVPVIKVQPFMPEPTVHQPVAQKPSQTYTSAVALKPVQIEENVWRPW